MVGDGRVMGAVVGEGTEIGVEVFQGILLWCTSNKRVYIYILHWMLRFIEHLVKYGHRNLYLYVYI